MGSAPSSRGAYGFRLSGFGDSQHLLVPAEGWPLLEVACEVATRTSHHDRVTRDDAEIRLLRGGTVRMHRKPMGALYTVPAKLTEAELIHPYLAVSATIAAYWLGRESLHAGAVVIDGAAWALIGDRYSGKSSTLGWLALAGYSVLCDDVLVIRNDDVFAGPRVIDLRASAARALGAGESVGLVGARDRWRLTLDQVEPTVPLRGCVFLKWADEVSARAVGPRERVPALMRHRSVRLPPPDPALLIRLAALPTYELGRPRRWSSVRPAAEALTDLIRR
jgi:hypothetical protein